MLNIARELSKWMADRLTICHKKTLQQTINYVTHTKHRGLLLKPTMITSDPRTNYFIIKGGIDSNYATTPRREEALVGQKLPRIEHPLS